ncbi:MAG: tRNA (N6-isopentenyl adenosine(37)-C2)-methylthiotransferase MiaB [Candidatus Falkowbacteria bacterium]|nr:tRNA (N6-isopentenyl adenosine(37)-C2)-methylthiotransferase MiaB [Candidatus Falkowbacteria bacterium]
MKKNTYHLITIGCQMNKADSERVASFLEERAFRLLEDFTEANLVILTTCGVRQSAEDRVYGLVNQIRKANTEATVVITGCLAKRKDVWRRLKGQVDLFMPINELPNIFELLEKNVSRKEQGLVDSRIIEGEKYLSIEPKYQSPYTAYVPIGNGCDNFCAYCVVPYARGREVYRPLEEVIAEVQGLLAKGYKEIVLIAQNVNSYLSGQDKFPDLLKKVLALPGEFWVRFSSSHPKDLSDELIALLADQKMCPHLHLAVQSGDDEVLERMNRKYTASHYRGLIAKARAVRQDLAITTDVIVGFPGETEEQFENSAKLFQDLKFDLAYTAQYSPRPGTVSALMEDNVSREEKRRREKVLTEILKISGEEKNREYLEKEVLVLVDGTNKNGKYYGKTGSYKTVIFTAPENIRKDDLVGNFVSVKIIAVMDFGLEGQLVI